MTTSLREAVVRLERYAHARTDAKHSTDILVVLSALQEAWEAKERLSKVYSAARDVMLATTQTDDGAWIISGDAEVMVGELWDAVETHRALSPGGADE